MRKGWKEEEKNEMRGEARKRLRSIGKEEVRNNIHKSIIMCLTHEQSIGSIYFVFFGMTVVKDNYHRVFCYLIRQPKDKQKHSKYHIMMEWKDLYFCILIYSGSKK